MSTQIKRIISTVIVVLMLVGMVPYQAFAAKTLNLLDGQVTVSDKSGTGKLSDGTVTITAKGGLFSQATNTITVANETENQAMLSFEYSTSYAASFTIQGAAANASGNYSVMLDGGSSITIVIKSNKGLSNTTATLKMHSFSLTQAASSSNVTLKFDSEYGSVTAADSSVSDGDVLSVSLDAGLNLVATAKSGATFLGWIDAADGKIISTATSFNLSVVGDTTVKAIFAGANSKPYFAVGSLTKKSVSSGFLGLSTLYYDIISNSYIFEDLNDASDFAYSNANAKGIVLLNDATLAKGNYTIDAGVTLLIPFDSANSLYTTTPLNTTAPEEKKYVDPTPYRTLTLAEGAKITVDGAISVSAKHYYANGGKTTGGTVADKYGFIKMNSGSNITVNNGGKLYAYGYIIGDGTVDANNGATVYEYFQSPDFRGGTQSTDMDNGVFPLSQYYVQNIEVPLTLYYGAIEYSYATIYMSSADFGTSVGFIGPKNAMFNLTSGYVVKRYNKQSDRLEVEAFGNLEINPITMDFGSQDINSKDYDLPLNGNLDVTVNSGSKITINQDVVLLPGARITVKEGAQGILGAGYSIYIYDLDQWGNYTSPSNKKLMPAKYVPERQYTRTESDLFDATVCVDGYLDVSAGYVYATEGGANIYSTGAGTIKTKPGTQKVTHQLIQNTGYVEIPLYSAKLTNADGTVVAATSPDGTYNYTDGKWVVTCNHQYEIKNAADADCENDGFVAYACPCGHEYTEITVTALGHTEVVDPAVEATCTQSGLTQGSHCSVCNKTIKAQTPVAALGHNAVKDDAVPATCTQTGLTEGSHCSVCNEVLVAQQTTDALGHTEVIDAAVPATCTQSGLTQGSHCSVCNEVLVAQQTVDALGHTLTYHDAKEPTYEQAGHNAYEECEICDYTTYVELPKIEIGDILDILSVYVTLDESISVTYRTSVPTDYTDVSMKFTMNSQTVTVTDYTVDEKGRYCFTFKGVNPQMMGDNIGAVLCGTDKDGTVKELTLESFTVKQYCIDVMANDPENAKLKTLVSDLLVYGANAQLYKNYKTDALVTDGVDLMATEFVAPQQDANKLSITGEDMTANWKSAGLYLANDVSVKVTFEAQDVENLTVKAVIGDKTVILLAKDMYKTPYGRYYFYLDGIMASQFDDVITFTFERNGEAIGKTLTYSVNTYVYQCVQNGAASDLVKAVYNYGVSASSYIK